MAQKFELSDEAASFLVGADVSLSDVYVWMEHMRRARSRKEMQTCIQNAQDALLRMANDLHQLQDSI